MSSCISEDACIRNLFPVDLSEERTGASQLLQWNSNSSDKRTYLDHRRMDLPLLVLTYSALNLHPSFPCSSTGIPLSSVVGNLNRPFFKTTLLAGFQTHCYLKGYFTQKYKSCHLLLTFMSGSVSSPSLSPFRSVRVQKPKLYLMG